MSQNSRINRARREAKQEKEGKKVVEWIIVGLIILALIFYVYSMTL